MSAKSIVLLAAILGLVASTQIVTAGPIFNGSFESGNLDGFTPVNDVQVVTSVTTSLGQLVAPTDGRYMALLTVSSAQTLSALVADLNLGPGQRFSFDWNVISIDYAALNGFVTLTNQSESFLLPGQPGPNGESLWNTFTYSPAAGFSGQVGWLLIGGSDNVSQLAIDRLSVPEPAPLALLAVGLIGLARMRRRSLG